MYIKQVRPARTSYPSRAREDRFWRRGCRFVTRGLSPLTSPLPAEWTGTVGKKRGPAPGARGLPRIGATLCSRAFVQGAGLRKAGPPTSVEGLGLLGWAELVGAAPVAGRRESCVVLRGEPRMGHLGELCESSPAQGCPGGTG